MPDPGRSLLLRLRAFSWFFLFALLALSFWFSAGWLCAQAGSLMNDLGYASRITQSLRNVLLLGQGEGHELLRQMLAEDEPLIRLD